VTKSKADEYSFRAAPLRNVAATAPYFHSGKVWKLQDAVTIMGDAQLGATLSPDEAENIHLFLHSLTAPIPDVRYPELPERSDTTPQPAG
jgi:cytochrome c peroxidase